MERQELLQNDVMISEAFALHHALHGLVILRNHHFVCNGCKGLYP